MIYRKRPPQMSHPSAESNERHNSAHTTLQVLTRVSTVFLNLANDADLFQTKLFDTILRILIILNNPPLEFLICYFLFKAK